MDTEVPHPVYCYASPSCEFEPVFSSGKTIYLYNVVIELGLIQRKISPFMHPHKETLNLNKLAVRT